MAENIRRFLLNPANMELTEVGMDQKVEIELPPKPHRFKPARFSKALGKC